VRLLRDVKVKFEVDKTVRKKPYDKIMTRDEFREVKKENFKDEQELERGSGFDSNQYNILMGCRQLIKGAIVEIGSRQTGNTTSFRGIFKDTTYVGVDMQPGNNVDVVCDLTQGIGELKENSFNLVICCSVLEHTPQPWLLAKNIELLTAKNGIVFMSVPWIWRYHKYPDDYFRFTPSAIKSLFPNIEWSHTFFHTNLDGDIYTAEEPGIENSLALMGMVDERKFRKFLPCTMLTMIGQKK
jgi:hypothetical protein